MQTMLSALRVQARRRGLSDAAWARAAGLRKETLSRLRGRRTCDLATLAALARAVGAELTVSAPAAATPDGHFPAGLKRGDEERLLALCASGRVDPDEWRRAGPTFFMAGLAVMLASARGFDRSRYLALAEQLHPGASTPEAFARWLAGSPLRPARFLPMLEARRRAVWGGPEEAPRGVARQCRSTSEDNKKQRLTPA